MNTANESILIVAAEASSSLYGRRILEQFKRSQKEVDFFGIGDQSMVDLGFEALGRSEQMAVVGLQEVLSHYSEIKSVFNQIVNKSKERRPKVAVLLDYPDFNLRLAKKLHGLGIPVVYFISPQLWAWRTSRIKLVQKYIKKMLVLFPFEEEFYKQNHVDCDFVGHPLLDEISDQLYSQSYRKGLREKYGIGNKGLVLGVMPGSRKSELKLNLESQVRAVEYVLDKRPDIEPVFFVAPTFSEEEFRTFLPSQMTFEPKVIKADPFEMIPAADLILTASGTATMMVGLMHVPMVIMYKMKPFTAWLARKLVTGPQFFGMINLIMEKQVCRELFQEEASAQNMGEELLLLINDPDRLKRVKDELAQVNNKLGQAGAISKVVDHLKTYLNGSSH